MDFELTHGDAPEGRIVVSELPIIVGSGPHADVRLDDPDISTLHCMIDQVNGTLVVSDLVSQNGTRVNGRRIEESPLLPGDRLTVGKTPLFVHYVRNSTCPSGDHQIDVGSCGTCESQSWAEVVGDRSVERCQSAQHRFPKRKDDASRPKHLNRAV